jgi:hypothetical protein
MLGIVYGKVCIPLFWVLLNKAGNPNAKERTDLMAKLNKFFPGQPVASLSGDREFIGEVIPPFIVHGVPAFLDDDSILTFILLGNTPLYRGLCK